MNVSGAGRLFLVRLVPAYAWGKPLQRCKESSTESASGWRRLAEPVYFSPSSEPLAPFGGRHSPAPESAPAL